MSPTPRVDDQFWFDWSKTQVEESSSRRDDAAAKLQSLVLWLWAIYTSFAAVGFVLSKKAISLLPALVVAAGSVALIAVYWATVWARVPVAVTFDPRIPDSIKKAYVKVVETKNHRFRVALILSVVAAVLVSVALVVASAPPRPAPPPQPTLDVFATKTDGAIGIAVSFRGASRQPVMLAVHPIQEEGEASEVARQPYILSEAGLLQTSVSPRSDAKRYRVTLEWSVDDTDWSIARIVSVK